MEKPKISVVMSVYNGMPFLPDAVKSILMQTYKNFEFIIVDDASIDGTWNYLKSLQDKRLKLIKNRKNLGLAASLNIALRQAEGDYIARMDADDINLPQRFEKQIEFLSKNPSIDLCGTWVDLINEKGRKIGEKKYPTDPNLIKRSLTWYTAVVHPTYMARKSFYEKLRGYRLNFDLAEDYDLLSRAKNQFKIANLPQKLLLWRLQNRRRSRIEMTKMDKVELMIKLESLRRDGFSLMGVLALLKKVALTYTLPSSIKFKIATLLKQA